jgi:glycosyltransferase involved in cell wall biosynthesis
MFLSVILSTYNQPAWLEKSLWGFAVQSHRDFEIVLADDGSTAETRQTVDRLRAETGLTIRHVWHADQGFRKCTILNRAIVEAQADYLVFTDGDCIPRRDFLEQHARFAGPRSILSAGVVRFPLELSHRINHDDIISGRAHDYRWLRANGLPLSRKYSKLTSRKWLANILDRMTTTRATWNGGNSSTWKQPILQVNGFDERMEYGCEDRELGERLFNLGLRGKSIRYRAICVHLEHARGYVRAEAMALNQIIRRETRRAHATWTQYGIVKQSRPTLKSAA